MVEIVELPDAGEAAFQHFGIGKRGDGVEAFGVQAVDEAVHRLAPGPEAVAALPCPFGEASHGALEGVAVDIGETGEGGAVAFVARFGGIP